MSSPACAITMCEYSDVLPEDAAHDRTSRLLPCCSQSRDHLMHEGCIRKLSMTISTPLACPLCRDNFLETIRQLLTFRNDAERRTIEEMREVLRAHGVIDTDTSTTTMVDVNDPGDSSTTTSTSDTEWEPVNSVHPVTHPMPLRPRAPAPTNTTPQPPTVVHFLLD